MKKGSHESGFKQGFTIKSIGTIGIYNF